jgi:hypothetical protein
VGQPEKSSLKSIDELGLICHKFLSYPCINNIPSIYVVESPNSK